MAKSKVFTVKIDEDVVDRARSAAAWMQSRNRRYTLGGLVEDALAAHITQLEHEHNEGKPFPPVTHPLLRGRRIGDG